MNIGAEPPEFLYSLKGGGHRFDRSSGVPRILCVTLPAICEDHEALYDRLAEAVPSYPAQTAAEHYHQLFMHLAHWLGRSRWVERSGASGFFADQLVENFPEARFIHLTRGTDATARSMAKHSVFRLIALRSEFIRRCGTDVFDSTDVLDNPGDLPGMPPDLADLLPGRLSRESLAAWEPGINTFRMLVSFQRNRIKAALKRVPENQVLLVRYEDLLDNATFEFERIATFLGLAHPPGWAKQAAALVRRPAPAGSSPRQ